MSLSTCSVCLEDCDPRGGKALAIPGCCGKQYHQECLTKFIAAGHTACPDCRAPLNIPTQPQPQALPPPPPTRRTSFNIFSWMGNSQNSSSEDTLYPPNFEDPLPDRVVSESSSHVPEGGTGLDVIRVTATCAPERRNISTSAHRSFYASVDLKYDGTSTHQKNPIDVVCVLDVSGSMNGSKLANLQKAVDFVIDTLSDDDRLSLVSFNSTSELVHGLARQTASNKIKSKSAVRRLRAGGGTSIFSGMSEGWSVLTRRRQTQNSCIFLLTDGQDRSDIQRKQELAAEMMRAGTSVMVFGFGADHDSQQMTDIANAAEGSFTYVDTPDTVIDAFGGAIGSQQGSPLTKISLNVMARSGVLVKSISSGSYSSRITSGGKETITNYAQMYPGEHRTILLNLELQSTDTWTSTNEIIDQELLEVKIQFDDLTNPTTRHEADGGPYICKVNRVKEKRLTAEDAERDIAVDAEINRLLATTGNTILSAVLIEYLIIVFLSRHILSTFI